MRIVINKRVQNMHAASFPGSSSKSSNSDNLDKISTQGSETGYRVSQYSNKISQTIN